MVIPIKHSFYRFETQRNKKKKNEFRPLDIPSETTEAFHNQITLKTIILIKKYWTFLRISFAPAPKQ